MSELLGHDKGGGNGGGERVRGSKVGSGGLGGGRVTGVDNQSQL